jgi:1-phosphofructokinase
MSVSPPSSILTLTGNLLAERTLEFTDWAVGRTQRARGESFQVGGKGINVSKMLHRLGAPTTALYFAGGATGSECERWLGRQEFSSHAFPTVASTRVGIVVRGGSHPETTFFGPDVAPDAAAVRGCADYLDAQPSGQVLAICGSLPGWATPEFDPLRAALGRWLKRGHLAADTYGSPLAWLAQQPLDLIKVNASELRSLSPGPAPTSELLQRFAPTVPVRQWIITDGAAPVWFCEQAGNTASLPSPRVVEVSATGSGDVFLACVLEAHFRRRLSLSATVAFALPYAAANAAHPGIAEFPLF